MIRGIILVVIAMAIPAVLLFNETGPATALFSQYVGMSALIAMSLSHLISTRAWFVQYLFGPLDRAYVLHKWLGICALAAVLLHDNIDAEIKGLGPDTTLSDLGETLGEQSLNGLMVLIAITLLTFIPYRIWYWTHRVIGVCFVLGALHFIMILKPFSVWQPLGLYVLTFCLLGTLAYIYDLMPRGWRRSSLYQVSEVSKTGNATSVTLVPEGPAIRHKAGQFAFVTVEEPGLSETHPFTISSAPRVDGSLRFSIGALGDYTKRLERKIAPGMQVRVQGPYGHFGIPSTASRQVWVAGGIGITPFLAWLDELPEAGPTIDLFYCFRGAANAPHLEELKMKAETLDRLNVHLKDTTTGPRLTAQNIERTLAGEKAMVAFCGPSALRDEIAKCVARRRFHFEEFEIRTGLPYTQPVLEAVGRWLKNLVLLGAKRARQ